MFVFASRMNIQATNKYKNRLQTTNITLAFYCM